MTDRNPNQQIMEILKRGIPIFQTLADSQRQAIVLILADGGELTVNEIVERMNLSRPAVSHHLQLLRRQGLADCRKEGTRQIYYLTLKQPLELLKTLLKLMEENCVLR